MFVFWKGGTRSRTAFLGVCAKCSLIISDVNYTEHVLVTCRSRVICKKVASGHKAKIEGAPPAQKKREALFFFAWCDFNFRFLRSVPRLFLQMTRLLQVTKTSKKDLFCPTSNRCHSINFVKNNALGGLPSSGTTVSTDFLKKKHPKNEEYTTQRP